ncbi:ribonuclease P protein component [Frankia torreyi]|uniref:Ribonuclease P protein component n=1 Tax=Frankia torreyi TaxID=1856 RepID=A0A0D8BFD3_9ACTN|nr:ribonuclease P protein component [Frankia sp. ACN1ag]KJE22689.1 ribonuclease P protein component [Frankia torreyi]KQM04476.1 ribonuclease P protein component [Frankia sp. CpI1-P]
MRTRGEHARVGTAGRRTRSGPLVVHSLWTTSGESPRAGFVVGRRVGKAVVRNRVRRRLREQVRARLDRLPPGTMLVVRALPEAASASSEGLGQALDDALARALRARAASDGRGDDARAQPARSPRLVAGSGR